MSKFKQLLPFTFILLFLFGTTVNASPSNTRPLTLNLNGVFIKTDSSPFIEGGRIMVPIRTLSTLGLTYKWDAKNHSVEVISSDLEIKLIQAQRTAYKNGKAIEIDSTVNNYKGRIMVPARFISEAFGYQVYYEKTRGILFIKSGDFKFDKNLLDSSDLEKARLAAISLPITYSFSPSPKAESDKYNEYHYTFAPGDASRYSYSNPLCTTIVEIKGGVARAVWQFESVGTHSTDATLGGKKPTYDLTPLFKTTFVHNSDGSNRMIYYVDGERQSSAFETKTYGDIIQPIPGT